MALPVYHSEATAEHKEQNLRAYAEQYRLIHQQEKDGVQITRVKIRCGCSRLVNWLNTYRCLYCGLYFCKPCAEEHFGAKTPVQLEGAL